ncbi:MAG: anaerobic ribonucleoside-triphosphate reductase activating protein [Candidatus ainarchaeum sp.]|nr:anaerobic ribonucleoside-triphosphate reductase activating protein [Candidatus ainarchaeum sp.]
MFIGGLEKTTLIDFPGKIACIVFLVNCNFKCPYCYNKELTAFKLFKKSGRQLIPEEEFFSFLKSKKNILDGVVITGGEPTCSPGIILFVEKIRSMGFAVKFDSNGSNPKILKELIDKKLVDYFAMDLKAPLSKYKEITRSAVTKKNILDSIELLVNSNIPCEFRTTLFPKLLVKDFEEMALLIPNQKWFLQEMDPKHAYEAKVRRMKPMKKTKIDKIIKLAKLTTKIELRN